MFLQWIGFIRLFKFILFSPDKVKEANPNEPPYNKAKDVHHPKREIRRLAIFFIESHRGDNRDNQIWKAYQKEH
jgi:hypothetical protein